MRFLRCIRADMRAGFAEARSRLLLVAVLGLATVGLWLLNARGWGYTDMTVSLGDTLSACLGGIEVFDPNRDLRFRLPSSWLLTLLSINYVTVTYPYRDLMGFGRSVLISSGNRWAWWGSKCVWTAAFAGAGCLMLVLACTAATLLLGGTLDLRLGKEAADSLRIWTDSGMSLDLQLFVLCWPCLSAAFCLLQLALSLAIRPVLSFGATAAMLLVSAYYFSPLLPGNYLMVARVDTVIANGLHPTSGLFVAALITGASIVLGGIHFSHMDCLDKEYAE